jgi:short-subunit dehydrogenase
VLINNAGIVGSPDQGAVIWSDRLNSARIRETFEVNCLAHYWTIKCVLPKMIERAKLDSQFHGSIVSITSVMGNLAGAGMSQYAASKAAANSIIRTLKFELWKEELSDRIHTLLVQPFILNTSMFASVSLGLSYLFQRQDAKSTAEEIVSAMLKKKSEITVPWFFRFFLAFILLIPDQILYWLLILARADTGMSTFENSK